MRAAREPIRPARGHSHLLSAALLLLAAVAVAPARADYAGALFDAHLHYNEDALERYPVGTLMELFSKNGVKAILANSRPNDGTRALVEATRGTPRERFAVVPFIRVYRDRSDYGTWHANPDIARMIVEEHRRGYYRGVGEFHLFGREAASPVVKEIVDFAVAKGLVLHAHCDEEALEILFSHNPKARIIWAHTGFSTPLEKLDTLLAKHPALWGELSYRSDVESAGRLSPEWRAFFTRHADRFLVGSDTWVNERWASYPAIMGGYRRWLAQLPPAVAEKIAWRNGARLFGIDP